MMMEDEKDSTVTIDIEQLQNFLAENSDQHRTSFDISVESKTSSCIFEVQRLVREVHRSEYNPVVVSIGPYHHGKQNLRDMEKVKWKCLEYILKANPSRTLQDYVRSLWELYPVARKCYAGEIKMQSKNFVHMLLLDGCFIIASICGVEWSTSSINTALQHDFSKNMDLEYCFVTCDFLLVENQIPFFIVKKIYELFTSTESANASSLPDKIAKFVEEILCDNPISIKESERPRDFNHLLHLCHEYFRPSSCDAVPRASGSSEPNQWHQALQYNTAGVEFRKRDYDKNNPHSLLDVKFCDDVLEIPYLFIHENTATIFRNLIALEETNPQFGNHVTAYVSFMSQLVTGTKDVALLVTRGIIGHHFDSEDEVLNVFISLGESVFFDFDGSYYLKSICRNLEACYKSRAEGGIGWLRRANSAIQVWI